MEVSFLSWHCADIIFQARGVDWMPCVPHIAGRTQLSPCQHYYVVRKGNMSLHSVVVKVWGWETMLLQFGKAKQARSLVWHFGKFGLSSEVDRILAHSWS